MKTPRAHYRAFQSMEPYCGSTQPDSIYVMDEWRLVDCPACRRKWKQKTGVDAKPLERRVKR